MRHIIKIWPDEILGEAICFPEMYITHALTRITDEKHIMCYRPYILFDTDDINMHQIATLLKDIEYDFRWDTIDDEKKEAHDSIHRRNGTFWLNYSVIDYDLANSAWDRIKNKYLDMINERR